MKYISHKKDQDLLNQSMRLRAVKALDLVLYRNLKPKEALDSVCTSLSSINRAFVMQLVYGALRHKLLIDRHINRFLKSPQNLPPEFSNILQIAVYEILFTDMPHYAVVNEAVNSAKALRVNSGLINAVLRNLLRSKPTKDPFAQMDDISKITLMTSHPRWLVQRWINRFGSVEASLLAQANNTEPPLVLRFDNVADRDRAIKLLQANAIEASLAKYSQTGLAIHTPTTYNQLKQILDVAFFVQDEASQLASLILNPKGCQSVLDVCSAPGGKTLHIASMLKNKGEVIAVDIDPHRIQTLKANIKASGLSNIKVICADILNLKLEMQFDAVLVDAPCSAIGVIRRNPDIKYKYSERDLLKFHKKQIQILFKASSFLKPQGKLLYSVCSTEPEEGEQVIEKFLQLKDDFCNISEDAFKPFERTFKDLIFYRTYPHRDGLDGFFFAKLQRA